MATLALSLAGQIVGGAIAGPFGAVVGRALGALAGSAVDAALFGEETTSSTGSDIRLTGSSEGGAVPRAYGWNRLSGNIIWATELERRAGTSSGSKGTSSSSDDDVITANFAVALSEGEVAVLGRIWADGDLIDTDGLNIRFYPGLEDQEPDSLIAAKQGAGNAPAYRGTCYLVFEALPLTEYGNRIPAISVEICRPAGDLEQAITAVTLIPGATEFGYDPVPRVRIVSPGVTETENAHAAASLSDWTVSLDQLQALCPNLKHVSLVIAWFGDDLRCGNCTVAPRVESADRTINGTSWTVSGIERASAEVVSEVDGGPAYGGTPSDASVLAAIADLKARGVAVTLYPIVMMDVPAGNALVDPYTGLTGQPAYPWRGRITCSPAPGQSGSPDKTATAAAQVSVFVGAAGAGDFAAGSGTVTYSGPAEWSYRRMILHYAHLSAMAGGVDTFLIGSELRGLTHVRSGATSFPFVDALTTLAADVRSIVGAGTRITYAADWSEYHGYQPEDAPGDKLFHLDPLWASAAIDAVGIDNYMPIADWRDGTNHLDADAGSIHDLDYLGANIAGGEGYDWYYASEADRLAQNRTPITDGSYGEPWVYRCKDLVNWWGNAHHNRIGGVRSATPTGWVPESKPIFLTELGCGAIDKGANLPSAFTDAKSSEDARPYFSSGAPDALMQRQLIRAHLKHWQPGSEGFADAANPVSSVYGGRMVDPDRIYLWTWDARPYPAFPALAGVWADAGNHATGHWLTGRLGTAGNAELIATMAADYGVTFAAIAAGGPSIAGTVVDGVDSLRDSLDPILTATRTILSDAPGGLVCRIEGSGPIIEIDPDDLVDADTTLRTEKWPMSEELPAQLALTYADRARDYLTANVTAVGADGDTSTALGSDMVLDGAAARTIAENALVAARQPSRQLDFALPPSLLALEPGDRLRIAGRKDAPLTITELRDGTTRRVSARPHRQDRVAALLVDGREYAATPVAGTSLPVAVICHLPADPVAGGASRLVAGAYADPWPGDVVLADQTSGSELVRLTRSAIIGELTADLPPASPALWDEANGLELVLYDGHLASETGTAVLSGTNRLLVIRDDGTTELIGFVKADLLAGSSYRLTGLLRGLIGTGDGGGTASAGNRVMLVTDALGTTDPGDNRLGTTAQFKLFAGSRDVAGQAVSAPFGLDLVRPLAPVHPAAQRLASGDVAITWVRRSRRGGDGWTAAEMPLDASPERYRITIGDGVAAVRTLTTTSSTVTYSAADQASDFGGLPTSFFYDIAQLSAVYGAGRAERGTFNG